MNVVLNPEDVFTIAQYQYTRFMFGTDRAYAAKYKSTPPANPGTPWAFALPAILSNTPIKREVPVAELSFGDLVDVVDYGTYRVERDHNRNVKFVKV